MFAELGVLVREGRIEFRPLLLRKSEFLREPGVFDSFDVKGQPLRLELPPGSLSFGYCGVPVVYHLADSPRIELTSRDGSKVEQAGIALTVAQAVEVFERTGSVRRIDVWTHAAL